MKTKTDSSKLVFAILFSTVCLLSMFNTSMAQKMGPLYGSPNTKEVIQKMIQAHGGMKTWREAKSVSYDHRMIDPRNPNEPWV